MQRTPHMSPAIPRIAARLTSRKIHFGKYEIMHTVPGANAVCFIGRRGPIAGVGFARTCVGRNGTSAKLHTNQELIPHMGGEM